MKHLQLIDEGHSIKLKLIDGTVEVGSLGSVLCG